jgi:dihydroorotate dehydrogenase electron transfer subunit
MLDRKIKVREISNLGGGNHLLTMNSPEQARLVQPGQFMMLKCAAGLNDNPLLRRPFSVFDVDLTPGAGRPRGLVLLVKEVGAGSRMLAALKPGQEVDVLGPQGRPFEIAPAAQGRVSAACLVAGGVGIAALYLLARRLLQNGVTPVLFYGGRTAADLVLREYFERLELETHYTTEDASIGEAGLVTSPLDRFLRSRIRTGVRVYACGPWAMMKAAHDLAVKYKVPCEVSLEARMGCSLGACMGCVVRTFDDDGEEQYLRVCLDGPIMDSRRVDWDTPPV